MGITLTSANFVYMLDPLLNTALDEQAVGRAWRMGQKRTVTVKRLYVKGTVEEAMMHLIKDRQVGMCTLNRMAFAVIRTVCVCCSDAVSAQY